MADWARGERGRAEADGGGARRNRRHCPQEPPLPAPAPLGGLVGETLRAGGDRAGRPGCSQQRGGGVPGALWVLLPSCSVKLRGPEARSPHPCEMVLSGTSAGPPGRRVPEASPLGVGAARDERARAGRVRTRARGALLAPWEPLFSSAKWNADACFAGLL